MFERPELFEDEVAGPGLLQTRKLLAERAAEAALDTNFQPPIAIMPRTKNDVVGLGRILDHVARQRETYGTRIDVCVVDTESTDGTVELAQEFEATIVPVRQETFTYPSAMNLGLAAISSDVVATFITVGHAQPALSHGLAGGIRHFKDPCVVAAAGHNLPHENASRWEKREWQPWFCEPAQRLSEVGFGVRSVSATALMIRMETWRNEQPFDEAHAAGGEDVAWARWAVGAGHTIIREPVLAVHHSHGLSHDAFQQQMKHYQDHFVLGARPFDQAAIRSRRPDLFQEPGE
jgi:rhamnosyltransferase